MMFKLLNYVLMLVILCVGIHVSYGEKLKCEFRKVDYYVVGTLYTCSVLSLDNSFNNMKINGYTGTHDITKIGNDVEAIYISETDTKYIPENLGSLFKLTALTIDSSQLVEIKSDNFLGMEDLKILSLWKNKLTSVPSDAFSTLKKLKVIFLHFNQIQYIASGVFDHLKDLYYVELSANVCMDKDYIETSKITEMKEDIKANCNNPNYVLNGEKLKCEFQNVNYPSVGTLYTCYVTSLDNFFNVMTIDGYTGNHIRNKNDNDVKAIWIDDTNIKYIPKGLGSLFNLLALAIQPSKLVQIKADNFLEMQNLEVLSLRNSKLTSVPSNALSFLPKLKYISLSYNQIKQIPSGLFTNNVNLEQIHLFDNEIKFLGSGLFDELTKLIIVDLKENICEINQRFEGSNKIKELKNVLNSKCKNPNDPQEIIINLKKENNELIKNKQALQNNYDAGVMTKDELKKEKDALKKKYDALMKEKDELKKGKDLLKNNYDALMKENDELKKEKDALKKKFDVLVMTKDALMKEKDSMKKNFDALVMTKDVLMKEKDTLKKNYDALVMTKDALMKEKDSMKKNFDALVMTKDVLMKEKDVLKNELSAAKKLQQKNEIDMNKSRDENSKITKKMDAVVKEKEAFMMELNNKTKIINDLTEKFETNCKHPIEAVDLKLNKVIGTKENQEDLKKMMIQLLKISQEHQSERQENIKLKTDLSLAKDQQKVEQDKMIEVLNKKDQLMKENIDLKKDLSEAKETIDQKLPKMEQTIDDFFMEVMDLKIERHHQRENSIGLRSKLMETNELLATCETTFSVNLRS